MIRFPSSWAAFFLIGFCLASCAEDHRRPGTRASPLIVATAANVQFAMEALRDAFVAESGQAVEIVVSSSGKLSAQISQGAPYAVFVSANMLYPQRLYEQGLAESKPRVYGLGSLVFWTMNDLAMLPDGAFLGTAPVRRVSIANPRNAPYGAEAVRALRYLGLWEEVGPKLVYGESIAQANQYILTQSCDVGITAKSVVLSPAMQGKGTWVEVDTRAYAPIRQGVVITRYGAEAHAEASRRFLEFLFSSPARDILREYGYRLPDEG